MSKKQPTPTVRIARKDYQPGKAELEADLRVDATFEEAIDALCRPVKIERVERPE
ncbi:MAG: hypothetical protein OXC91_10420 [Rhodobacteraceae bacterium]|nr:hypothetical protein [Paracoccaceae bacterium]